MQIDPWGSSQYQDYARLRDEFGIAGFGAAEWGVFRAPHRLLRRGVVFGHRDFERVSDAVRGRDPWSVMTGFMPSGDLHMGHKMVLEQVIAHQAEGADVHLCLADFEAMAARGFTQQKAHRVALDQYVHNALALGLRPDTAEFYFQTRRMRVQELARRFAQKVNWSTLQALYGFGGDTSIAHVLAPLVQAADILHPQTDDAGPRPVLVPVGVDQDPHIRLTRDVAQDARRLAVLPPNGPKGEWIVAVKGSEDARRWLDVAEKVLDGQGLGTRTSRKRNDPHGQITVGSADQVTRQDGRALEAALGRAESLEGLREAAGAREEGMRGAGGVAGTDLSARRWLGFVPPSATFHRFMTGLQGGKMSSSKPETSIFLTEAPATAEKKLRSSVTGGRATAEEQRRIGAEPLKCPVYELYLYHLAKDDAHLATVFDECSTGKRLCGGCKAEAATLLLGFLKEHKEKRDETAHLVPEIVAKD
ncbi:MAG TPA: tryptophan--tRNA ligase [Candidatus Thermoplasmatota archaeon]|nr:tryptophan--tRNA ligase [Candidatus Thermoplasmatota archaeon]